jgi:hypothetical protein
VPTDDVIDLRDEPAGAAEDTERAEQTSTVHA